MLERTDTTISTNVPVKRVFQKRKQLERDLEHITQEMYKRNRELIETNKTLSLIRTIDTLVLESPEPLAVVCQQITNTIATSTDYPFISLFTRTGTDDGQLELHGFSVKVGTTVPKIMNGPGVFKLEMKSHWFGLSEKSRLFTTADMTDDDLAQFIGCLPIKSRPASELLGLKSIYAVKLYARHKLVGMIVAGFYNEPDQLSEWEVVMLDRLSEGIGIVLDNKLLFEENRRVVRQLQRTNIKLKALDETKDDFISMASHQLRTPLTAVKGYLSMVLEGDAGSITPLQKKMLNQAFMSSQRMVFLIADLLNVSRLKTGKFIIERAPLNLANLIQEEIGQLRETAKSQSLELTYAKPKDFPLLMLDETKTRQVVMNFIDNAIHYTPAKGHISVELSDKPHAVELRVKDDGIGVPKTEQHHLFTKFYRAVNARRERPDGTGLGLFMAKKVVVAQGGAVLFESKENQGSTFGFTIPKAKLVVNIDK